MKNTKQIGDISQAKITAALLTKGKIVLTPYGDNQRYDLVIDENNGTFFRIQCKTGRTNKYGNIDFSTKSVSNNGKIVRNYRGQVEYFAVYHPPTDKCYLIPEEQVGTSCGTLRIKASNQKANGRLAEDYEL